VFLEPSVNLAPRRRRATRVQFVDPLEEDDEGEGGEGGGGGEGDRPLSPAPLHSAGGAAFHPHLSSPPYGRFLADAEPGDPDPDPSLTKKSLDPDLELTIPFLNLDHFSVACFQASDLLMSKKT
jgi:hypothetical protein